MIIENKIHYPYGIFSGVTATEYYPEGCIKGIILEERNMILTHAGELIPFYSEDTARRKYKSSVAFHKNGMIKSVSLDQQQEVLTPIGEFPAELITFYDTGEIKRVFPLNGKISAYWSEEDECALNIPFHFKFDFSEFTAMLIGICFYKSGSMKSLTLFPGETIEITIPDGTSIEVKNGFSLYENGNLKSVEPAAPVELQTPIGTITAYDSNATGINADVNSLAFDEQGQILSLLTSSNKIIVNNNGKIHCFAPGERQSPIDENEQLIIPLCIDFDYENSRISITDSEANNYHYKLQDSSFYIHPVVFSACSSLSCSGCKKCSHE